ncbi:MAG: monovalent cation/H(+) antiporter subunit G [Chromatiaceae bacterium]|nr:monovalent cation/H(+) antiporter subunit G [Chromatiaceae bacterium]MCF7995180.1 monovalent cation/H(+) antiporter subunit G [Chromatiaceae bacterium]
MSDLANLFTLIVVSLGLLFFVAGVVGLLRFPDPLSRLHALTKADALGLGLVVIGLLPQVSWPFTALKLLALWVLMVIGGSIAGQLIAATQFAADAGGAGGISGGDDHVAGSDELATDDAAEGDTAFAPAAPVTSAAPAASAAFATSPVTAARAATAADSGDDAAKAPTKSATEIEVGGFQPEDASR